MSAADNIDLARREKSLPGLSLVLDPSRVQDLLRSQQAIGPEDRIELVYVRYKPGRRALSLMQVVEPSGRQRPLVVNACDAAGWDKVVSIYSGDEDKPSFMLAEFKSTIEWFPRDRRLRQAAKLFNSSKTTKILERVVGERPAEPWVLSLLAYKPHRRLVVKASSESTTLALKCYTAKDYPQAFNQVGHVANAHIEGCSPRVVGASEHYQMIASAWIDGEVLSGELNASSNWQHHFPKVGNLLARWHTDARRSLSAITNQHTAFARGTLTQLAEDIVWLLPEISQPLSELLAKIDGTIDKFATSSDLIHGDFYAKQIIVQGDGLHLIDFDEVARGHCYQDLGTFVGQLYWSAVRNTADHSAIMPAIEAFVGGYEQQNGTLDWPLFQTSVVAGVLRCMPHAFRRGLPEWRSKMHQMFEFARQWCPQNSKLSYHTPLHVPVTNPATSALSSETDSSETSPYLDTQRINQHWQQAETLVARLRSAQVVRAQLMRHKPGKRLLVEYTLQRPDGQCEQVIGKARLKKPVDQKVVQLHSDLQGLTSPSVRVPRVLGTLPPMNLWLQEKISGQAVKPDSPLSNHRAVGQALAALHGFKLDVGRSHSIQDELAILTQQFEQWLTPIDKLANQSKLILDSCFKVADDLIPVQHTLIHRDFYFDQVLSTGDGVALLDFDLAKMGPPELDVGNYLAHLDEYALRNNAWQDCLCAGEAFLAGYIDCRPWLQPDNVQAWRYLSLARLVAISQRIASRSHTTSALLELCRQQTPGHQVQDAY